MMKKLTNRKIIVIIALLYFIPIAVGIAGSFLGWNFSGKLLQFGIYLQGVIVITFVILLLINFLRRFW